MFYAAFFIVLLLASVIDIKTHTVPVSIYLLLILLGLYHPTLSALGGLVITFIPLLITGLLFPARFGGGDIKFGALCGFILTGTKGLIALFFGAILCLLIVPILLKLLRKSIRNTEIPLLPFLSVGCVIAIFI